METSSSSSDSSLPQRPGLGSSAYGRPSSPSTSSESASSVSDGEVPGLSSAFGGRLSRSKKRPRSPPPAQQPNPGAWEVHTRGIGSRILAKQGFTGRLGKRGDGIAEPLQPVMRTGKKGLGADRRKEKRSRMLPYEDDVDAEIISMKRHLETVQRSTENENRQTSSEKLHPRTKLQDKQTPVPAHVINEVNETLERARRRVSIIPPQLLYDLNSFRDLAISDLSSAKRGKEQESFILENTRSEKEKAEVELEDIKHNINKLVRLENLLVELERAGDTKYAAAVDRVFDMMREIRNQFPIKKQLISAALSELVCEFITTKLLKCLRRSQEQGRADKKLASLIYEVLLAAQTGLSSDDFVKLCTASVLGPLRKLLLRPDWDAVRGACIADVLVVLRPMLSQTLTDVFAEDILVPKLLVQIKNNRSTQGHRVPYHVWIHPWLPVTGRKALVEVLHHIRISLAASLASWRLSDSNSLRNELISNTKMWSSVLSRKKLQLTLSRHVTSKLAIALRQCNGSSTEAPAVFEAISAWASVCSNRLLAAELAEALIKGPGATLRYTAFKDWKAARQMYERWKGWLPYRLRHHFRPVLAALLFVLHAARTANEDTRTRLLYADMMPLLRNRFKEPEQRKTKKELPVVPAKKARLVDVVAMVAEKEGLPLIGLPDERGLRVFKLGEVRVTADVRRGIFLVGSKVVSVTEMVKMAKAN